MVQKEIDLSKQKIDNDSNYSDADKFCKKLDEELGEWWSNDYSELAKRMQEYAESYHKQKLSVLLKTNLWYKPK